MKNHKMKVHLIGGEFNPDIGQGISRVCGELYKNLKKLGCGVEKIELKSSKNPFNTIFTNVLKNFYITIGKNADIYHFLMPELCFPCFFKRPSIVTVYDIIPLVLKNERKKSFNIYFKIMMKFVKKADHILVISESTKKDLINILKIPKEKISLIYLGVDHEQFYPLKKERKNEKITIGFLGGLVKRKNAKILLDVAKKLENENVLFKIGGKGKGLDALIKKKKSLKLKNVEFVGFIPEKKLNNFYNSLDLFIVPTIYDGFSLPGLEAMACGCPIISSNTSALPEVVGNAGILVNPLDPKEISKAIQKLIKDKKLRRIMGKKSIIHAKKFRFDQGAKETLKIYKKVLKRFNALHVT